MWELRIKRYSQSETPRGTRLTAYWEEKAEMGQNVSKMAKLICRIECIIQQMGDKTNI